METTEVPTSQNAGQNIVEYQAANGDLSLLTCLIGASNHMKLVKSINGTNVFLLDMETLEVTEIDRPTFDASVRWLFIDEVAALFDQEQAMKHFEILKRAYAACGIYLR